MEEAQDSILLKSTLTLQLQLAEEEKKKIVDEYKKKIEERSRAGVYFEVKKQTLYYYGVAVLFAVIVYQTFKIYYRESEKTKTDIERIRLRRHRYRDEEDIY